jgi:chromosome segregation ATPase
MNQEDIPIKVGILEEKVSKHDDRLNKCEESVQKIPRIETLMEISINTNKEFSDTLKNINANLTGLNSEMSNLGGRVGKLEQSQEKNQDENSIHIPSLLKTIIVGIVSGAIIYFGMKYLGVKSN